MQPVNITGASAAVGNPVVVLQTPGIGILYAYDFQAPTASAAGYAPGSLFVDHKNAIAYVNTGTATSATWLKIANGNIASSSQAALGAVTTVGSNTGTAGSGLSLIGNTTSINQASAIMNDFAALREDISALFDLVGAIRTALVSAEIIKGSA